MVFALHKLIPKIEDKRQALFTAWFAPIGVSAIFYIYVSLEFLNTITVDGAIRSDAENLSGSLHVVVWFLVICSIVVHGLSVPLGKFGFYLPRTISRALTTESNDDPAPFRVGDRDSGGFTAGVLRERRRRNPNLDSGPALSASNTGTTVERPIFRIGGTVIRDRSRNEGLATPLELGPSVEALNLNAPPNRTIRFPDE